MEGIVKLKECLKAVSGLIETAALVMEDGKVGVTDVMQLPALFSEVRTLVSASQAAVAEVKDLDLAEAQELLGLCLDLVSLVASKFDLAVK